MKNLPVGNAAGRPSRIGWGAIVVTVAAQCAYAEWAMRAGGFSEGPPYRRYIELAFLVAGFTAVLLLLVHIGRMMLRREEHPIAALAADARKGVPRFAGVAAMFLAITFSMAGFNGGKIAIFHIQPYFADPALAALDRIVFGTDAWRITHGLIGPAGTRLIDATYAAWAPINLSSLVLAVVLIRDERLRMQVVLTYVLIWAILGTLLATVFSSVGPCFYQMFYGDPRFEPLIRELHNSGNLAALKAMNYLASAYQSGRPQFGAGISAMPSLHVAITVFLVLIARRAIPSLTWPAIAYSAVILFGSVHLGWHYASDGVVGALGAVAIWSVSGWLLDWPSALAMSRNSVARNPGC